MFKATLREDIYAEVFDNFWKTFRGSDSVQARTNAIVDNIMKHIEYHNKPESNDEKS